MSGATAVLNLTWPNLDQDWYTSYESNLNILDALFHPSTGHTHSGTGTNGPKIPAASLDFDVATQAELDAHAGAADPHTAYLPKAGGTITGPILVTAQASHTVAKAAPGGLAHAGDTDTGLYFITGTNGRMFFTGNGEDILNIGGNGLSLDSAFSYAFSPGGNPETDPDVELMRVSAGVLGLVGRLARGGTDGAPSPRAVAPYNYRDNADGSYERLFVGFSSDAAYVETQNSGGTSDANPLHIRTGGAADLFFGVNANSRWKIANANGAFLPVATDSYNIGSGSRSGAADLDPSKIYARNSFILSSNNGCELRRGWVSELTTIAAAATTDTTITIPAGVQVKAVSIRVTVAIPTATTFDVGVVGDTQRYGAGVSTASPTTTKGMQAGPQYYSAATAIRITPNATPSANTGRVRVTIFYDEITPADS